jgi:hypothetical protein
MTPDAPAPTLSVPEMQAFIEDFFERIRRVREAGQREYAHTDANVFGNFDRIAAALGLTRETVMMTYALKHMDGIVAFVRGHRSQREHVTGRVEDLVMYLLLLAASEEARGGHEGAQAVLEAPSPPEARETARETPVTPEEAWLEGYRAWRDRFEAPGDWCLLCERTHLDPCDGEDELHAGGGRRSEILRGDAR